MAAGNTGRLFATAGQGSLAVVFGVLAMTAAARADERAAPAPARPQDLQFDMSLSLSTAPESIALLGEWRSSLVDAAFFDDGFQPEVATAPALELAAGLNVEVDQKRRKFRAKAVDWITDRSVAMGKMTDFLLGGAETGWHVVIDPTGQDEYILEWKVKFH